MISTPPSFLSLNYVYILIILTCFRTKLKLYYVHEGVKQVLNNWKKLFFLLSSRDDMTDKREERIDCCD